LFRYVGVPDVIRGIIVFQQHTEKRSPLFNILETSGKLSKLIRWVDRSKHFNFNILEQC